MLSKSGAIRRFAVVGAAAALAGGIGISSAAATVIPNSSGGGCSNYASIGNGMSIQSCISANGGIVYPDGYVSGDGPSTNCTLYVDLIQNGSVVSEEANTCASGHIYGYSYSGSGTLFTGIYAVVNGSTSQEIISPNVYN